MPDKVRVNICLFVLNLYYANLKYLLYIGSLNRQNVLIICRSRDKNLLFFVNLKIYAANQLKSLNTSDAIVVEESAS